MIKKIRATTLDKQYLASRPYTATPISADLKTLLVNKPWGSEYLMYRNPAVEIWHLSIRPQRSTSMHCHPKKRTSLLVLEGRTLFSTLNESWELLPMDTMVIEAGVFHSTQCLSRDVARVLEFESPPMKHDLVRLEDKYGRTEQGYEGIEHMTASTALVRFFDHDINNGSQPVSNKQLCIRQFKQRGDIGNHFTDGSTLAVILSGVVRSQHGEALYSPANVVALDELRDSDYRFEDLAVLLVGPAR